jgi:DNA invertase Pin-like site-specific DNA recombinase
MTPRFEREVIGERIRDKFAASRRKGMWMGGTPPLGYDVVDRGLRSETAPGCTRPAVGRRRRRPRHRATIAAPQADQEPGDG